MTHERTHYELINIFSDRTTTLVTIEGMRRNQLGKRMSAAQDVSSASITRTMLLTILSFEASFRCNACVCVCSSGGEVNFDGVCAPLSTSVGMSKQENCPMQCSMIGMR